MENFKPYFNGPHVQLYKFDNGHGASVATGLDGKEVAVIKFEGDPNPEPTSFYLNYNTSVGKPRVGLQTEDDVQKVLAEIAALPKVTNGE